MCLARKFSLRKVIIRKQNDFRWNLKIIDPAVVIRINSSLLELTSRELSPLLLMIMRVHTYTWEVVEREKKRKAD